MSIVRTYSVFCDGLDGRGYEHADGCARWVVETTTGAPAARREAREVYRWIRKVGHGDLSPQCSAAIEARS